MAKFIKFPCINTAATQPFGPSYDVLINVDNIAKIAATGGNGKNTKTLVISMKESVGAGTSTNPKTITFGVFADTAASVDPTLVDGKANVIYDAAIKALTANPGGIKAKVFAPADDNKAKVFFTNIVYS